MGSSPPVKPRSCEPKAEKLLSVRACVRARVSPWQHSFITLTLYFPLMSCGTRGYYSPELQQWTSPAQLNSPTPSINPLLKHLTNCVLLTPVPKSKVLQKYCRYRGLFAQQIQFKKKKRKEKNLTAATATTVQHNGTLCTSQTWHCLPVLSTTTNTDREDHWQRVRKQASSLWVRGDGRCSPKHCTGSRSLQTLARVFFIRKINVVVQK